MSKRLLLLPWLLCAYAALALGTHLARAQTTTGDNTGGGTCASNYGYTDCLPGGCFEFVTGSVHMIEYNCYPGGSSYMYATCTHGASCERVGYQCAVWRAANYSTLCGGSTGGSSGTSSGGTSSGGISGGGSSGSGS